MDKTNYKSSFKKNSEKKRGLRAIRFYLLLAAVIAGAGFFHWKNEDGAFGRETLSHPKVEDNRTEEQVQNDFSAFTQQIFIEEVTDDSITLNFTLKDPTKFGITDSKPTLGNYSLSDFQDGIMSDENWLASLESFDYEKLTTEQKLIYDILHEILKTNLKSSELLEYSECLGPTTGIQAQLPVLLAEYNFYAPEDVETYLDILKQVPHYFEQIIAYEQKKSKDGLFMSDATAQAIIDQCQEFITNPQDNYLITIFKSKLKKMEDLSSSEISTYQKQNKEAVTKSLIPAYQALIDCLTKLKGTGNNEGGLCQLEKGKEYYAWLVESMTGSNRSVEEINKLLDQTLTKEQKRMSRIMTETPDAYYDAQDVKYPCTDPAETVDWLKQQIAGDFSFLSEDVDCNVKYVDESLEDSLSPAFYLTSPMDDYKKNVIYINQSEEYDLSQAFSTIAHESYPGHLYQNCYFQSTNPAPIRSIINIGGYTEGWGTYAELYSYQMAGLDKEVVQLLQSNTIATLCLYAKADIGVNYLGWSEKKLAGYLEDFGFDSSQSKTIYQSMVAEPVSYMQYTLGYLEIEELLETAKSKLGNDFSLKEFHKFFLSIGSAPFVVIEDRMSQWIEEEQQKKE